ncbi:hypothetical protein G9A89_022316 [Geosiphon pyriformis]|nr:hypothetical protein G9A89_022316 [Geosiphon pyriformis]
MSNTNRQKNTKMPSRYLKKNSQQLQSSPTQISATDSVIAYTSRTLKPAKKNYPATELETAAVIWALYHFNLYLRPKEFNIITDNIELKWLQNKNTQLNAKQT